MTREEAIAILIREVDDDPFMRTEYREHIHEALNIAIKALEHPEENVVAIVPCGDAISRQAVLDAIYKMHMNGKEGVLHDLKTETGSDAFFAETIADAVEALEELPSVNPQPKTGHWIKKEDDTCWWYACSECEQEPLKNRWNDDDVLSTFCPNCGAKMEGSDADSD